jgi:hypothetical protein
MISLPGTGKVPWVKTTQYWPGGTHADSVASTQLFDCAWSRAPPREMGQLGGTSATKARAVEASRSETRTSPSPFVSTTLSR